MLTVMGQMGYRLTAIVATIFCFVAGLVFTRYHEAKVLRTIGATESASAEEGR
ncbi:MAG: hypothetical protein LKE27_05265 [Atopobiaceae bacterium]|jgi:GPH family glycoside/pentoside/hexuronide:cation symporter|nr:hypothetical protein [Atopobiaceae bacterium]